MKKTFVRGLSLALALSVPTTSAFAQSPIHPNDFASETDTEAIYEEMEKLSVDELQAYISECADYSESIQSNDTDNQIPHPSDFASETDMQAIYDELEKLSVDELQAYISECAEYSTNIEDKSAIQKAPITNVAAAKSAWIAAAAVASKKGYPLSATIVVSSVGDNDYSEVNGQFAKAIKKTSIYDSMVKNGSGPNIFTKSMNPDLFYSIHKFDYSTSGGGSGARLRVHDVFDFEMDTTYEDLFTTIINDAGYLMEWAHVLNEIDINIYMDI